MRNDRTLASPGRFLYSVFPMTTQTYPPSVIFLTGARASGKTTVGRALAEALDWPFTDTDHHLLRMTGRSVAEIVAQEGWDGFRARESRALCDVAHAPAVIATGGGMVLAEANRRFMRERGLVLYLHAPAALLAARLEARPLRGQRPSLTGRGIVEEVADVLAQREALYRDAARHVLDATLPPARLVARILEHLEGRE